VGEMWGTQFSRCGAWAELLALSQRNAADAAAAALRTLHVSAFFTAAPPPAFFAACFFSFCWSFAFFSCAWIFCLPLRRG